MELGDDETHIFQVPILEESSIELTVENGEVEVEMPIPKL